MTVPVTLLDKAFCREFTDTIGRPDYLKEAIAKMHKGRSVEEIAKDRRRLHRALTNIDKSFKGLAKQAEGTQSKRYRESLDNQALELEEKENCLKEKLGDLTKEEKELTHSARLPAIKAMIDISKFDSLPFKKKREKILEFFPLENNAKKRENAIKVQRFGKRRGKKWNYIFTAKGICEMELEGRIIESVFTYEPLKRSGCAFTKVAVSSSGRFDCCWSPSFP
jgi:vacuolar-type H+-ATPase subunit I/STV1